MVWSNFLANFTTGGARRGWRSQRAGRVERGLGGVVFLASFVTGIGGHRHRSQCRRYPTSDIVICYSDIGDKYVGLKNITPILEVFRYRHQSSFRYPTLKKKENFTLQIQTRAPWNGKQALLHYATVTVCLHRDVGYQISDKTSFHIRYNVGLCSLSPISEVLISGSVRYR